PRVLRQEAHSDAWPGRGGRGWAHRDLQALRRPTTVRPVLPSRGEIAPWRLTGVGHSQLPHLGPLLEVGDPARAVEELLDLPQQRQRGAGGNGNHPAARRQAARPTEHRRVADRMRTLPDAQLRTPLVHFSAAAAPLVAVAILPGDVLHGDEVRPALRRRSRLRRIGSLAQDTGHLGSATGGFEKSEKHAGTNGRAYGVFNGGL